MEMPALVVLERAERAARERRLAAGLEAERRIADARAEAVRVEHDAAAAATVAAAAARRAVSAAADREMAALRAGAADSFHPAPDATAAARAFVVRALLAEDQPRAGLTGDESPRNVPLGDATSPGARPAGPEG